MKNLEINVSRATCMVSLPENFIAVEGENLQSNLIFKFTDEFVDGTARLEYRIGSDKNYVLMTKSEETYSIPIKNVITKEGRITMQLVITQGTNEEEIPVFKSNVFYLYCNESVNAVNEEPYDSYELWIEQANAKLNLMDEALAEVDNLDIDVSKSGNTSTVTITKKDGTEKSVEVKDATINGMNSIELVAGQNIQIQMVGNQIIISATGVTPPTPTTDTQFITSDNRIFLTSDNANFILKESD